MFGTAQVQSSWRGTKLLNHPTPNRNAQLIRQHFESGFGTLLLLRQDQYTVKGNYQTLDERSPRTTTNSSNISLQLCK